MSMWRSPEQKEAVLEAARKRGMLRDPLKPLPIEQFHAANRASEAATVPLASKQGQDSGKRGQGAPRRGGKQPNKYETDPHPEVSNPKPERHQAPALDGPDAREKEGVCRTRIRFTGYRVRPLDPDNFAGSVKDLLDGLRHAALISGDEPWRIILETEQVKVRGYAQEKTVIEIDNPTT